jgi:Flp pilus assembly protein TadG
LPVFLMFMLGIVQMGLVFHQVGTAQHALEEAARTLMVRQDMTSGEVEAAVRARLGAFMLQPVTVTQVPGHEGDADVVRVNLSFTMEVAIPFVPLLVIPLGAQTTVPIVP